MEYLYWKVITRKRVLEGGPVKTQILASPFHKLTALRGLTSELWLLANSPNTTHTHPWQGFLSGCLNSSFSLFPADLNECGLKPRPCKHRCMNTYGSYKCYCLNGYMLQPDGTCGSESRFAFAHLALSHPAGMLLHFHALTPPPIRAFTSHACSLSQMEMAWR